MSVIKDTIRNIFEHRDSGPRIARGVAAGFFAAAFPLPGLQIPLSLLVAWVIRGNRAVCIFPQFISNAGTMFPLAVFQYYLGQLLWPGKAQKAGVALRGLEEAFAQWTWAEARDSSERFWDACAQLGVNAMGPLLLGVLLTALAMGLLSYPFSLTAVWLWRSRKWKRQYQEGAVHPVRQPLDPQTTPGDSTSVEKMLAAYAPGTVHFFGARGVHLLVNGSEAYPRMLRAIEAAKSAVVLETYILVADRTGKRFAAALKGAAGRGVEVRLLYDAIGSLDIPDDYVRALEVQGVEVRIYHPLMITRPLWALNRRDHRKVLVIDGDLSFTGGLNISDAYGPREEGGLAWRDTHLEIEGHEAAGAFLRLFERTWAKSYRPFPHQDPHLDQGTCPGGKGAERNAEVFLPRRALAPDLRVAIIGNREFTQRRRIRKAYIHAIRNAKHYILIENAYFIPDRGVRKALTDAVGRGVTVAVAVARSSDVVIADMARRALYSELLASGIRLYEWPEGMLHAKTAVIDDVWSIVGSYNFDHRSLLHSLEVVAIIANRTLAQRLREQTLEDMRHSEEVEFDRHEARPFLRVLLEGLAFQFRYWL